MAEHRENQRRALMAAGRAELVEHGPEGVRLAAVGTRAGLARSSVYEYFSSASDLITEIAAVAFEDWGAIMTASLADVEPGAAKLHAYVNQTMRMVAEGRHEIAGLVGGYRFTAEQSRRFRTLHEDLMRPLRDSLTHMAVPEPDAHALLIQGMLDAATRHGADPSAAARLAATINNLIDRGLPVPPAT
ncbi:TetR/AcrR family transcriptional regulator [Specibacter cremeus]|uniref:TetR/AcrR family transcriptional regulator n=1 Tax=Specibacter cremeus TaxID=1629051 RepID=UPI0013DDBAE2|nr:TetR/AcrR family transcriptional regulator [Specibacter cremeus]